MILYAPNTEVTEDEVSFFLDSMKEAGRFSPLPEKLMDAGASVAGCGPAFVDLFVEALADGGVACGLPRAQAIEFAAQMVAGSAKLILESKKHPGQLKDEVCSPGGTTIQGVRTLEEAGFRGAVMDAVIAAYERTLELK
jgi:pyrroline-5-carboxylate reductase